MTTFWQIETTGITHNFKPVSGELYTTEKQALIRVARAIKAGRLIQSIRIVKVIK